MYRIRLAENFVQIALLVFEIRIFEVDCPVGLIFFFLAHLQIYRRTDRQIRGDRRAGSSQTGSKADRQRRQRDRQAEGQLDRQALKY
jgi:hypothetical protein